MSFAAVRFRGRQRELIPSMIVRCAESQVGLTSLANQGIWLRGLYLGLSEEHVRARRGKSANSSRFAGEPTEKESDSMTRLVLGTVVVLTLSACGSAPEPKAPTSEVQKVTYDIPVVTPVEAGSETQQIKDTVVSVVPESF